MTFVIPMPKQVATQQFVQGYKCPFLSRFNNHKKPIDLIIVTARGELPHCFARSCRPWSRTPPRLVRLITKCHLCHVEDDEKVL